jgi:hypothetical protein
MRLVPSARTVMAAAVLTAAALGSHEYSGSATPSASAGPPQATVTATLITRPGHTLAPGTKVSPSKIFGQRVFVNASHGFALVDTGQAQYPAASADGGKTWQYVSKDGGRTWHYDTTIGGS